MKVSWTPWHWVMQLRDDLWLVGDIRRYTGTESPTSKDDAQLLPGYPATDPAVERFLTH